MKLFTPKAYLFAAVCALAPLTSVVVASDKPPQEKVADTVMAESLHKIHINTASADELQLLKGIGKAKAQAIVDFRESHGQFETIEQLEQVKGIGKKLIEKNVEVLVL